MHFKKTLMLFSKQELKTNLKKRKIRKTRYQFVDGDRFDAKTIP
jgi:hypothetical protein